MGRWWRQSLRKKGICEGGVTVSGGGVEDRRRPEKRVEGIEPSSIAWKATALPNELRGIVNLKDSIAMESVNFSRKFYRPGLA